MAKSNKNAAPTNAQKPGDAGKPKKDKVVRVPYAGATARTDVEKNEAGEVVGGGQLTAIPTDFDRKKHLPLGKKDFAEPGMFYEMKAAQYTAAAKVATERAQEEREFGSSEDRSAKKKFKGLMEKAGALAAQLKAKGIDVDALVAAASAASDAK